MEIRKAMMRDIESIFIFQRLFYGDDFDTYHEDLEPAIDYGWVWVACAEDGGVIGYIACKILDETHVHFPRSVFLSELFVDASHRSCGVGSRLVEAVLHAPWPSEYVSFSLTHDRGEQWLSVFYEKFGFTECGITKAGNACMTRPIFAERSFVKKAIVIHGWKGSPDIAWFPWLVSELTKRGFEVNALRLPRPFMPDRWTWTARVRRALASVNPEDTVIIAHSLGCPTLLFALAHHTGAPFRRIILVGGFAKPFPIPFVRTWFFGSRPDMGLVKTKARSWSVIHGDRDPLVPYRRGCELAEQLGVECRTICGGGHFTPREKCSSLPEILEELERA